MMIYATFATFATFGRGEHVLGILKQVCDDAASGK
jgi:hypothetical protein